MQDQAEFLESPLLSDPSGASGEPSLWSSVGLVITLQGPTGSQRIQLSQPYARIGSSQAADVVLEGEDLPPCALYLHATEDGVFCCSLIPPTDARQLFHGWVAPGRAIAVGAYELSIETLGDSSGPPQNDLDAESLSDALQPSLIVSKRGRHIHTRKLTRRLTIVGRLRPSTVRIRDPQLFPQHCALYWTGQTLWFVDLLSGAGTRQNGIPIAAGRCATGETLYAGEIELAFEPPSVAVPSQSAKPSVPAEKDRRVGCIDTPESSLTPPAPEAAQDLPPIDSAIASTAAVEKAAAAWREEREALEERIQLLSQQLQGALGSQAEAEAGRERAQRLTRSIAEQEAAFAQERASADEERQRLEGRLAQVERQCESLEQQLEEANRARLDQIHLAREELAKRRTAWEAERRDFEARRLEAVQELESLRNAQQLQDAAREELKALRDDVHRHATAEAALREQLDQLQRNGEHLQGELTRSQAELASAQDAWTQTQSDLAQTQEQLLAARREYARASFDDRGKWREEREKLQDRIATLGEELRQSLTERIRIEQDRENSQAATVRDHATWDEERLRLAAQLASVQTRTSQVEAEKEQARDETRKLRDRLASLMDEVRELRAEQGRRDQAHQGDLHLVRQERQEAVAAFAKERAAWSQDRTRLEVQLTGEQARVSDLEAERDRARQQAESLEVRIATVLEELQLSRADQDRLKQAAPSEVQLRRECEDALAAMARVQEERTRLEVQLAAEKTRVRQLEVERDWAREDCERALRSVQLAAREPFDAADVETRYRILGADQECLHLNEGPEELFLEGCATSSEAADSETKIPVVKGELLQATEETAAALPIPYDPARSTPPVVELDDPEALNRMMRFARQKRGKWLPAMRTVVLAVLWGLAAATALGAIWLVVDHLAQQLWVE